MDGWVCMLGGVCGETLMTGGLVIYFVSPAETVQALFKTTYSTNLPFQPVELLAFAVLG